MEVEARVGGIDKYRNMDSLKKYCGTYKYIPSILHGYKEKHKS